MSEARARRLPPSLAITRADTNRADDGLRSSPGVGDGGANISHIPLAFHRRDVVVADTPERIDALVHRIREELKCNTTCGASNISFGLPNRHGINSAFLCMAIGAGMTSAITNPLHGEVVQAVMGADVVNGQDENCARWIRKYREPAESARSGSPGPIPRRARPSRASIAPSRAASSRARISSK